MIPIAIVAALSAALAIAAGAFGAHGASGEAKGWLQTGGQYQLVHAVAALALVALQPAGRLAPWLLLAGAGLFAVSLYLMALGLPRWLGAVTPVGGTVMIAGWLVAAWVFVRS